MAAGPLALAASASGAVAAPTPAPARAIVSAELDELTRAWRRLLDAEGGAAPLGEPPLDALGRQRDALLERILAFRARSAADVLAKLRVADQIDPFADAAEEGDVKAIWALAAMADLERLTTPPKRTR